MATVSGAMLVGAKVLGIAAVAIMDKSGYAYRTESLDSSSNTGHRLRSAAPVIQSASLCFLYLSFSVGLRLM